MEAPLARGAGREGGGAMANGREAVLGQSLEANEGKRRHGERELEAKQATRLRQDDVTRQAGRRSLSVGFGRKNENEQTKDSSHGHSELLVGSEQFLTFTV